MAKGRSQRGREVKKPKGGKKPTLVGSTFLRPQSAPPAPPTTKEGRK